MQLPLSVIITTFNEAHNIKAVIDSVEGVDEIIVVDSYSTDGTADLALELEKVTLFQREYVGPADQKNWAIPLAKNDWILILDADERVTPPLKQEIAKIITNGSSIDAYWIHRQNFFLGRLVRYSGWQNDAVIRLIKRDKCRYNLKRVHEEI